MTKKVSKKVKVLVASGAIALSGALIGHQALADSAYTKQGHFKSYQSASSTKPFLLKGKASARRPFGPRLGYTPGMMPRGVKFSGIVQGISGSTLTVASTSTVYTVDAGKSRIVDSNRHKGSVSNIQINDNVTILGRIATTSPDFVKAFIVNNTSRAF